MPQLLNNSICLHVPNKVQHLRALFRDFRSRSTTQKEIARLPNIIGRLMFAEESLGTAGRSVYDRDFG